ncbi:MAG: hypothetical protein ACRDZ1_04420 [Acidimicrobiia bacterium]
MRHDPAGRLDGEYVDVDLVIDLCDACHEAEHAERRTLGLDVGPTPEAPPEQVALVLRRVADSVGRFADAPTLGGALAGLAAFLAGLAGLLRRLADALDGHVAILDRSVPGWREAIA